jgi:hypothetical protein
MTIFQCRHRNPAAALRATWRGIGIGNEVAMRNGRSPALRAGAATR